VALIAQWSRGIPRLVNSICDNALLLAYSQQSRAVRADEILEVARDLDLPVPLEPLDAEGEVAEAIASPGSVSETKPVAPKVNGNGHSNGNGHKSTYSNGHSLDTLHRVAQQVEQRSIEPPTKPSLAPLRPDLPAESERVRAQAATRPRPSVFQRAERSSPNAPSFPVPSAAATPAPAANTLREIVRVRKLARSEAPAPKVSRLMGWLIRVGLVTIHANGHRTVSFAGLWRNK
jgi:hypothetical protein